MLWGKHCGIIYSSLWKSGRVSARVEKPGRQHKIHSGLDLLFVGAKTTVLSKTSGILRAPRTQHKDPFSLLHLCNCNGTKWRKADTRGSPCLSDTRGFYICGFHQLQVENSQGGNAWKFPTRKLEFATGHTYLCNVYIVSGFFLFFCIKYYKNPEPIQSIGEDVHVSSLHANTKPFFFLSHFIQGTWAHVGVGICRGPGSTSPWIPTDNFIPEHHTNSVNYGLELHPPGHVPPLPKSVCMCVYVSIYPSVSLEISTPSYLRFDMPWKQRCSEVFV